MATRKRKQKTDDNEKLLQWVRDAREEAEDAKRTRMDQNAENFDAYHLRHNFAHKQKGQSQEVLAKQPMAVEQISSFFQQALVDVGDWFRVNASNPKKEELMMVRPETIRKITQRQLEKAKIFSHIGQGMKSGLLGGLIISKVHGKQVSKPKYIVRKKKRGKKTEKVVVKTSDKVWQLQLDLVRQENYYPDPTGEGLYEIEDMWMDYDQIKALSEGDDAIYDAKVVEILKSKMHESPEDLTELERETDQEHNRVHHRKRVKVTEYWGNILDKDTGELIHENIVMTMANDKYLLRGPSPNPLWHQQSPFVAAPLLEVPHAVWPKALMDAPTKSNRMMNELYNLIVDGAMKAVNAISQVRPEGLVDPSQVSDGIAPGTALLINSKIPVGGKVAEPVITADVPADALNVLNVVQQEFNASSLTSDLRQGATPSRSISATAVVEASQTITSIFQGLAKNVETLWIKPMLEKSWMTIAQMMDDLDDEELEALVGESAMEKLENLSAQERFVETVNGIKFDVSGIAQQLKRQEDFRKWTTLLQTIGSSEVLLEAFVKKYDFTMLLKEVMQSLGVDTTRIELPEIEQLANDVRGAEEGAAQPGATPDTGSQQPQAQALSLQDLLGETAQGSGGIPQSNFPGSPALRGQ